MLPVFDGKRTRRQKVGFSTKGPTLNMTLGLLDWLFGLLRRVADSPLFVNTVRN